MASSLTTEQKIALFQILRVPYDTGVGVLDGEHNITVTEFTTTSTTRQAYQTIMNHLDGLDSDVETVLEGYLDSWIAMPTTGTILDGSVGSVSGIAYSEDAKREAIREMVKPIVPYYMYHDRLGNQAKNNLMIPNQS